MIVNDISEVNIDVDLVKGHRHRTAPDLIGELSAHDRTKQLERDVFSLVCILRF